MESILTALNRDIIQKKAGKKVLFQPRINAWLDDKAFSGIELPGKYAGCDRQGLYEKLGCSDRLYNYFNFCLETHFDESVKIEWIPITDGKTERDYMRIVHTPVGDLTEIMYGNDSNYGMMPYKWLVSDIKDFKALCYLEEATTYSFNMETYNKYNKQIGHLGLPVIFIPRTNIQKLLIELSGVEDTYYILADYPDEVEHYFDVLSKSQEGMLKAVANSPIEWINYGDNLHCSILPGYMFERYILPEYEKRGEVLHQAGKFLFSHWDGDCKDYLKYAKTCFLDGIEAVTPIPQGDVTIEEVKEAFGDEIVLIDGLPAVSFTDIVTDEKLAYEVEKTIDLFAGQIILGISDEMPSNGSIEKVEMVTKMVVKHNESI